MNCWQHLKDNFRLPTSVTNTSWEKKFWPATLQDSMSPNVLIFCLYLFTLLKFTSSFHKWNVNYRKQFWPQNMVFWWIAQHRKIILWPQIYLRVIKAICWATQKIYFLTTTHGHLPLPSYTTSFPDDAGQNTCTCREFW